MSKISKQYSKHQKYLKYLSNPCLSIQVKLIYMLALYILAYIIQIYMKYIN